MSNNFKIINANCSRDSDLIASMHQLRYQVFYKELKWSKGLELIRKMEFDEYDRDNTSYIVRINDNGHVDATCRLLPTAGSYMIADHYPHFVDKIPLPRSKEVWEISRFCASIEARKTSGIKVTGQLIAAAIEFGIVNDVKNYIALATDSILPVMRRLAGWDPTPIGSRLQTPDDHSYSILYTVSQEMLEKIRLKNNINEILLFDTNDNRRYDNDRPQIAA